MERARATTAVDGARNLERARALTCHLSSREEGERRSRSRSARGRGLDSGCRRRPEPRSGRSDRGSASCLAAPTRRGRSTSRCPRGTGSGAAPAMPRRWCFRPSTPRRGWQRRRGAGSEAERSPRDHRSARVGGSTGAASSGRAALCACGERGQAARATLRFRGRSTRNQNRVPSPGRLETSSFPPISVTSSELIASPSPTPPRRRSGPSREVA
jgi:hypothetical protein